MTKQPMTKRKIPLLILILGAVMAISATHDYFLMPESFFLHKGDKLILHMVEGDQFTKQSEVGFHSGKVLSFSLLSGKKKIDLTSLARDSNAMLLDYPLENAGQNLISVTTGVDHSNSSRDAYSDFLNTLGYDKLADKVKTGNQFRVKEKYARYMKTLFSVENHDGHEYDKVLNEASEIVLKDNPYSKRYGEDLVAQLLFKGKPAKGEQVFLYIKSLGGNVYTQNYTTDDKGEITLTMSREGIYMLRNVHVEPTTDKDADYVSWWTTYTFSFSSSDEVLNSYKQFGFGDVH
jgi:uncharacterized GH25 family protein